MAEERRISPAVVIGGGLLLGLGAALGVYALTRAAPPTPPPEGYVCPHCGAEFATEGELLAHIELEHPELPPEGIYCPYCGAGPFTTIDEANEHIKANHPGQPLLIHIEWT
ncbi:hypothetical protein ES704_01623 [subsurface metagenome]